MRAVVRNTRRGGAMSRSTKISARKVAYASTACSRCSAQVNNRQQGRWRVTNTPIWKALYATSRYLAAPRYGRCRRLLVALPECVAPWRMLLRAVSPVLLPPAGRYRGSGCPRNRNETPREEPRREGRARESVASREYSVALVEETRAPTRSNP